MGVLGKLYTFCNKLLLSFLLGFLPDVLRLAVLGTRVLWKRYKLVRAKRTFVWAIDEKSPKFYYDREKVCFGPTKCGVCLCEFEDQGEVRRIVECGHTFHRQCLETWLLGYYKATCPMCRGLVAPEAVMAEYREMKIKREDGEWIEKEVALIFLKVACGSSCNGYPLNIANL